MLFKRKVSAGFWERVRTLVWPRRSFSRSARYYSKRILRLNASPHSVGAGVAAGVFASFFPLGFHFIIAGLVAWLIAGNLVAAALGTAFGNPVTFPFLWGASYETGKLILHEGLPSDGPPAKLGYMLHHLDFSHLWEPILKPMAVGAVPLGMACGILAYFVTRWAMSAFREQRRMRLAERAARHGAVSNAISGPGSAQS
jgi:uncharacterized protein (DUF2062 family)